MLIATALLPADDILEAVHIIEKYFRMYGFETEGKKLLK